MKYIRLIDAIILRFFQKISDWFQVVFGITSFTLAKICIGSILTALGLTTFYFYRFLTADDIVIDPESNSTVVWQIVYIIGTFIMTSIYCLISGTEEYIYKNNPTVDTDDHFFEQLRPILFFVNILTLFRVVNHLIEDSNYCIVHAFYDPMLYQIFFMLCIISQNCYIYFATCRPKTPKKSKLRKLCEKLLAKVSQQTKPSAVKA